MVGGTVAVLVVAAVVVVVVVLVVAAVVVVVVVAPVGRGSLGTVLPGVVTPAAAVVEGTAPDVARAASGSVVGGDEVRSPPQATTKSTATKPNEPSRRNTTHLHPHHVINPTHTGKRPLSSTL
jgi:hypothetical protein